MNTVIDLREIAQENNLSYVETTSQANGYPSNIQSAIIGFDSFEQAEDLANEYGLQLEFIEKKDGWALWYRTGNTAYEPITIEADDFGANCRALHPSHFKDETHFIQEEVLHRLEQAETISDLTEIVKNAEELWNMITTCSEEEIVVADGLYYRGTYSKTVMHHHYDCHHTAIALVAR